MDGGDIVELSWAHLHRRCVTPPKIIVVELVWTDCQNPEIVHPVSVHFQQMPADMVLMQPLVSVSVDLFCLRIDASVSCWRVDPQLPLSILVEVENVVVG